MLRNLSSAKTTVAVASEEFSVGISIAHREPFPELSIQCLSHTRRRPERRDFMLNYAILCFAAAAVGGMVLVT